MPFSYINEEERSKKNASSTSGFDRELDEAVYKKSKKTLAKVLGMSEEDFKWYVRKTTAWKYLDGKLFQSPK